MSHTKDNRQEGGVQRGEGSAEPEVDEGGEVRCR